MPATVYALLVGINAYRAPHIPELRGCLTDIERFGAFLQARLPDSVSLNSLCDAAATRAALVATFRQHLGQAGPGDTALFYFSGHGSQEPVAPEHSHLEPTGYNQTLVCHDSRTAGAPDLSDKELAILIDEVARRGAHTVAILDCCHAGGATRSTGNPWRSIPPASSARGLHMAAAALSAGAAAGGAPAPPHVALSACMSFQRARELTGTAPACGAFSQALLAALAMLGPTASYRDLIIATRSRLEASTLDQHPVIYPAQASGIADQPFLGGAAAAPAPPFSLSHTGSRWEINGGSFHGIRPPAGDACTELLVTLPDAAPQARVRVLAVEATRSQILTADAAHLDPQRCYPAHIANLPQAPVDILLQGDASVLQAVRQEIASAGPAGAASAYLRVVELAAHDHRTLVVQAQALGAGQVRLGMLGHQGQVLAPAITGPQASAARRLADQLQHIARWQLVKDLAPAPCRLDGQMLLEVVACPDDRASFDATGPALPLSACGDVRLRYRHAGDAWLPPRIFVRVRHRGAVDGPKLYVALLSLNDSYAISSALLPGTWIAPGNIAAALDGGQVAVQLPSGRAVEPGASVRDWLLLFVAERDFSVHALELPALQHALATRSLDSALDYLRQLRQRDPTHAGGEWTVMTLPLVTEVPQRQHSNSPTSAVST